MTDLATKVENTGFYAGQNRWVAVSVKVIVVSLVLWASLASDAGDILMQIQSATIGYFGGWYIYASATFMVMSLLLAVLPRTGSIRLGCDNSAPEFSRFAWFSMMFGAGIGVGMLTYSTAEPLAHFTNNPDVILGTTIALDRDNLAAAYKWTLLHYGLTPWGCYAIVGMSLAYFAYRRDMPLTIRSPFIAVLSPETGRRLGGVVDAAAILATIIGIGVTIGYGVNQLAFGMHQITGWSWLISEEKPSLIALSLAVIFLTLAAMLSALSGIGRGIRWLSNLNMALSWLLLLIFVLFGATAFAGEMFVVGLMEYLKTIPVMSFTIWDSSDTETARALSDWQSAWTVFYWAWWIAFTPFVGLFLARVSRGRTIREYVVGAILLPSLMCFTWFCIVGGTALDLELQGAAQGSILEADLSAQLFATVENLFSPGWMLPVATLCVVLLITYLVTSADSAVLVINTIVSGGVPDGIRSRHIVLWSVMLGLVIITLLFAGGMDALRSVMIIGALPFSAVMVFMLCALIYGLWTDRTHSSRE
ncbi:MAG: BCCT family transporter [Luminiphilus sp.]|jgi:choline/carnitine/betaine transport|nr:BCCT family transporter [Luminiphilus sp.]